MPLFQPFVYEGENFVQSDMIYNTDVVVFLNRTEKKLYLWAGKRAGRDVVDQAQRAWVKFVEKYSDFKATNLIAKKELTDFELAKDIRALLGQHEDEDIAAKSKSNYNMGAKISSLIGILFLLVVVLQAVIILVFQIQGELLVISEANFTLFFDSASILLYITEGSFIGAFFFAILAKNSRIAVASCLAAIVNVGFWFYLDQRDFLFYFQNYGEIPGMVQILGSEIAIFMGILALILLGVCMLYLIADRSRPKSQSTAKVLSPNQDSVPEIPSKNSS